MNKQLEILFSLLQKTNQKEQTLPAYKKQFYSQQSMSKLHHISYPLKDDYRQCTDCVCVIAYVTISITIFMITCYSLSTYSIYSLITPTDSDGQMCGIDLDKHPYLYFISPHVDSIGRRVCVAQCPTSQFAQLNCSFNSKAPTCDFTPSQDHQINVEIYPTELYIDRVCLPQPSLMKQQIFQSLLKVDLQDQKIVQIGTHWQLIVTTIPVVIIVTLLLIIVMRYTACVSVYLLLLVMVGLLFLLALYFYANSLQASTETEYFGESISQQSLQTIMAVTFIIIGLMIFILFCCDRKKINLAIKLLKSSAKFVNEHLYLLILSFLQCFFGLFMMVWWIVELWGLIKAKQIYIRNQQIQLSPQADNFTNTLIMVFHVFFFLWTYHLITQSGSFIVSGAVTNWYYSHQKTNVCCPSYDRYTGYHIGSVCAGSFYLAIFGPIRVILQWMRSFSRAQSNTIFGRIQQWNDWICCLALNRILTICNKGSYAFVHLAGKNYCESSSKIMSLRLNQPVISGIMTFLEIIFSLILRVQVVVVTIFWGYWSLHYTQPYKNEEIGQTWTLACIICVAFFVSKSFLSVYSQATDSIIVCFMIDKQENHDFIHCPEQLRQYLQEVIDENGFVD